MVVEERGPLLESDSAGDSYRCYLSMNWMGKWVSYLHPFGAGFADVLSIGIQAKLDKSH